MQRGFGGHGDKGKSEFLRKKKQERAMLEQRQKERKAACKLVAVFRRNQQYRRFVKPFVEDSLEKVQLILEKRRETPPEKYSKMIANVLYKMPFILQTLIFVNDRNLTNYEQFVRMLTQAIVGEGQRNDSIKRVFDNKGFPLIEVAKLARFALSLLDTNPVYEQLVVQFVAEAVDNDPSQLQKFLSRKQTRQLFKQHYFNGKFLPQNRQLILQHVFLPHDLMWEEVQLPQFVEALLSTRVQNKTLYQAVDKRLLASGIFSCDLSSFKKTDKYHEYLTNVCRWLHADISMQQSDNLTVPLFIHNRVLQSDEEKVVDRISETYLSRKLINQLDKEDKSNLLDRVRKSADYNKFLQTIDLRLYFGELMQLFKRQLEGATLQSLLKGSKQETSLRLFSELYLLLGSIFRNMHNSMFDQLSDKGFLLFLLNWFAKADLSKIQLFNPQNDGIVKLLGILASFLYQRISSMDDVEFASEKQGFTPKELELIVLTLNSLLYEIIAQNTLVSTQLHQLEDDCVLLLNDLYNKNFRSKLIDPKLFEMPKLNGQLLALTFDNGTLLERLLKAVPFALDFESRLLKLRACIKEDKQRFDRDLYQDEEHDHDFTVEIRRGHEFNDAFHQCYRLQLRNKYIIVFTHEGVPEPGIDGGGIIKEFLNRVIKTAFDPLYGLFKETPLREIVPTPKEALLSDFSKEYEFIGMIVGKAVYENILIEAKFSGPFLNLIVGRTNGLEDLRSLDPELYRSLIALKHSTEDIVQHQLTFSFTENGKTIQLKENGSLIPVTNENKLQFIMAYADFKVNKQLEQQSRMFRKGLTRVLNRGWLEMFNHDELNLMISGKEADFDVNDLRNNTVYNGYNEKDVTIVQFWDVVRNMTSDEKSLLLLFVTSCSRPPTLGFAELKPKFCIAKSQQLDFLPTAHTCMNILRLPDYQNKATLLQKLRYAINAKAGFEFV